MKILKYTIFIILLNISNNLVFAQNVKALKLVKIKSDTTSLYEYSYTKADLIFEEKSKYRYVKYNYDNSNKLITIDYYEDLALFSSSSKVIEASKKRIEWANPDNTKKSHTITYEYNELNQVIKLINYMGYSKFVYDKKNRISKQVFYNDNKISYSIDYKYDKKGNLINHKKYQISDSGDKLLDNETIFKYDDKINPFKNFNLIPGKYTNQNNIVKTISRNFYHLADMKDDTNISENFYKYNEFDYPIQKNGEMEYIYE